MANSLCYVPGYSITTRRLKKSCSLNIKVAILKTVLFYPRCVKLGSVIPGFNRSFLPVEIGDFLQKAPFENMQKSKVNLWVARGTCLGYLFWYHLNSLQNITVRVAIQQGKMLGQGNKLPVQ